MYFFFSVHGLMRAFINPLLNSYVCIITCLLHISNILVHSDDERLIQKEIQREKNTVHIQETRREKKTDLYSTYYSQK